MYDFSCEFYDDRIIADLVEHNFIWAIFVVQLLQKAQAISS